MMSLGKSKSPTESDLLGSSVNFMVIFLFGVNILFVLKNIVIKYVQDKKRQVVLYLQQRRLKNIK